MCNLIPIHNKKTQTVSWKGQVIPLYSYCMVYESLKRILEYVEAFARNPNGKSRTYIIEFLTMQSSSLIKYVNDISPEAWGEALCGAVTLQRYLVDGDEPSKDEAKRCFIGIWKSLYLDELFKKRPDVIERELVSSGFQR